MRNLLLLKAICLWVALLTCGTSNLEAQTFTLDSTVLVADTVITGLNVPWELKWGVDDFLWMTEREGKVSRLNPQTGIREVILDMTMANGGIVHQVGEAGMLGFDFHPNFPDSNYLYIAYTHRSNGVTYERLSRFLYDGDSLINELYIIDSIIANTYHAGSRVLVGPDNKLYMTTGDALNQPSAQDISSLSGKILRVNLDGTVPSDNPIPGSPLWSWGHRNPQGLYFAPSGILYSSEHGPNTDDEINIIHRARNYGWPNVAGICNATAEITFCADSNVAESIYNWTPTIAPSDLIFYDHPSIPEWQGSLLLSVLKNKRIIKLTLNAAGDSITSETSYFVNQWGRLRDICVAPNGTVYIATNGASPTNTDPNTHSIIRLQNLGYVPPLAVDAGADLSLCAGDNFTINASTSGGALPLSYNWSPAAGLSCSNCPNPVVSPNGYTTYVLTVTDDLGNTSTDTINVNVVNQPGPFNYTYNILDTIEDNLQAIVQFNFNLPAADSAIILAYASTFDLVIDSAFINTQQVTIIDTFGLICTSGIPNICGLEINFCVYGFSLCGSDSLCASVNESIDFPNGIRTPNTIPFSIYPNPTNGGITISGLLTNDNVTIVNALGKVLRGFTSNASADDFDVGFATLPQGIYFVRVERDGAVSTQKLIKQ